MPTPDALTDFAEQVRSACLQAALDAYEDAGVRGLCAEGRWEVALDAIRSLALDEVISSADTSDAGVARDDARSV